MCLQYTHPIASLSLNWHQRTNSENVQLKYIHINAIYQFFTITHLCNGPSLLLCMNIIVYRVICRARLVPFPHELEYDLQSTTGINKAFNVAPAAGPLLIKLGHQLASMQVYSEPQEFIEVQNHVKSTLPELDSQGAMEYILFCSQLHSWLVV